MSSRKSPANLILGTAQIGMKYGIANSVGQPSEEDVFSLLKLAVENGILCCDTAQAYGESESLIGKFSKINIGRRLDVITKLSPLSDVKFHQLNELQHRIDRSVFESCEKLGLDALPVLLLHRWEHRFMYDQFIWKRLLEFQEQGVIVNLGVSVSTPEQAFLVLKDPMIKHIQLPFNILDWRWRESDLLQAFHDRQDVTIHTRSTLLQGLLVSGPLTWERVIPTESSYWVQRLDSMVEKFERVNRADLCFAYVRSQPWINGIVVGVETCEQLIENCTLFNQPCFTKDDACSIEIELSGASETLLNPSMWRIL
jgi:aryl-alcohol dehydrogenase-like predicted oxidoreductase